MKTLIVLGSGSCVPNEKRNSPAYFLDTGTEKWLIDIGRGSLRNLLSSGNSYRDIDNIFISHVHPDHISELMPLIQALSYTPGFIREKPLLIYGSNDVKKYLELNTELSLPLKEDFPLVFVTLEDNLKLDGNGWSLYVRKLKHSANTSGFRWSFDGCVFVYGADTGTCEAIIDLSRDADMLILESSFMMDNPAYGHMTTFQTGEVAERAGAKRLLISHFYPEVAETPAEKIEKEIRASGYKGEIFIAADLLKVNFC